MKKLPIAIALCAVCASASSYAEVRINGFASIVGGKTLDDDTTLYGYDNDISFKNESVFALQLSADLQDKLSATAQIVARGENDFDAEFEWAYLTYEFTDELQLSAGKMRVPFYRYSDFLDVGYAYRWVRPPQSVYNLPFSTYEGLSLLYSSQIGDWDSTLQGIYGSYDGTIAVVSVNGDTELNDIAGVNWTLSYDWFSARAAYFIADTSIAIENDNATAVALNELETKLRNAGFVDQADNIAVDEDDGSFLALGFSIDYNNVLFDAEYTEFEVDNSALAKQTQYYTSVGYRIDEWTVHLTYENNDDKHEKSRYNALPAVPDLNQGINLVLEGSKAKSNVYTIGTRYDFHPSAALKVDFSRFKNDITDTETDVVAVAVDLVF
ncbi:MULTISPECIES: porin [unclassified Pseudoalteromonas]|uniref:porin n=1 Tax=unclassified Pseudoalteromonas TaxID=194690 RepID=UPI0025B38303|nr:MULTISPECIES: porin [unclassified Pseudoalteromonas]MDN3378109.1 porin [Pseudoalteromonas sp. APC 3893]MDN3386874.1 porin [Pseudoalteromonas sp. APC 4017]